MSAAACSDCPWMWFGPDAPTRAVAHYIARGHSTYQASVTGPCDASQISANVDAVPDPSLSAVSAQPSSEGSGRG